MDRIGSAADDKKLIEAVDRILDYYEDKNKTLPPTIVIDRNTYRALLRKHNVNRTDKAKTLFFYRLVNLRVTDS